MRQSHIRMANIALFLLLTLTSAAGDIWADDHRRGKNRQNRGTCMENPVYTAACGSCHMLYAPMLLPAASWEKLVPASGEHFGEKLDLKPEELQQVRSLLLENAADKSPSRLAQKISRTLKPGDAPERLEDVPYLQRKHRKIAPEVFKRKSVGGLANCVACHQEATRCNFNDDDVRIPQ